MRITNTLLQLTLILALATLSTVCRAQHSMAHDPDVGFDASRRSAMPGMTRSEISAALYTETDQVLFAQQYGLGYLPLMIVRQYRLIEKYATAAGLGNVQVRWARYPSGKAMNSALQAGLLDFAAGGAAPMISMWDRTFDAIGVRGLSALSSMPLVLTTTNPAVKSVKDFTERDRIAVPATRGSTQAVLLQIAAARVFGVEQYKRFDALTVSMTHPAAMKSLLSQSGEITAHFASPPFQYQELENPKVASVSSSFDLMEGPATFTAIWGRESFRSQNPRTFLAVYAAIAEAMQIISNHPRAAAEVYLQQSNVELSVDFVENVLRNPLIDFTMVPEGFMKYAKFMYFSGAIKNNPNHWSQMFYPEISQEPGS